MINPYFLMLGDCLDRLKEIPDNTIHSVVTDPPYGLSFMGKAWDKSVPSVEVWKECLRVLKPGGYLLAFAGTRTQHRMAVAIEDAGFEIRDMIAWVYGSGFPKSHDIPKGIDKIKGVEKLRTFKSKNPADRPCNHEKGETSTGWASPPRPDKTNPHSAEAKQWEGWGTALKPALEPITVARKPFNTTVAKNVLEWGTGGINIDGCRVGSEGGTAKGSKPDGNSNGIYGAGLHGDGGKTTLDKGRFPANLIHDGSDEVVDLFPKSKSVSSKRGGVSKNKVYGSFSDIDTYECGFNDSGSAARFFYCVKASKKDRNEGLEHFKDKEWRDEGACIPERKNRPFKPSKNNHPTVKPTELMRYLCRLVTPPGGVILDPFLGSGSTGKAAMLEDFKFVGIELEKEYLDIAKARIVHALYSADV